MHRRVGRLGGARPSLPCVQAPDAASLEIALVGGATAWPGAGTAGVGPRPGRGLAGDLSGLHAQPEEQVPLV